MFLIIFFLYNCIIQLVTKKKREKNFPNVNLVLNVFLTIPTYRIIFKNVIEF
jgi:hypothetical protein